MSNKLQLTIIDEHCNAETAHSMLVNMLSSQSQYYSLLGFSRHIRFGENTTGYDQKVKQLAGMIDEVKQLAKNAGDANHKVAIKGTIEVIIE